MKKMMFFFLFLVAVNFLFCQADYEAPNPNSDVSLREDCFNISISCDVKINLDCPEKSSYLVNITQCGENFGNPLFCYYKAELYFGDQLIESKNLSGIPLFGLFQGNFNATKFGLHRYFSTPEQASFEIKVFRICSGTIFPIQKLIKSDLKNIQIIKTGETYTTFEYVGPTTPILRCEFDRNMPYISCGDVSETIEFCITNHKIDEKYEPGSTTFTFTPKIKIKGIEVDGFGFEYTLPKTYPVNETIEIYNRCLTLKGEPGLIVYMGYRIDMHEYKYKTWKASCISDIFIKEEIIKVPGRVNITSCKVIQPKGCPPMPGRIEIKKETNLIAGSCKGSIYVNQLFPDDVLKFRWSGPNGFNSDSKDLEEVEYGEYTLTVTDLCCNIEVFKVLLCKNLEVNPGSVWEKDPNSCRFCRDYICTGDPVLGGLLHPCEGKIVRQCIEPDNFGPEEFDYIEKKCFKKAYYKLEELGKCYTNTEIIDDFDNFFGVCQKKYICNGQVVYTESSGFPIGGFWQFNSFSKKCEREVSCDKTKFKQEKDPMYGNWEYNKILDQCEREILCDNSVLFGIKDRSIFPFKSDWTINEFALKCTREIYCSFGSSITQEVELTLTDCKQLGEDPRCPTNYFLCFVVCGGERTNKYICRTRAASIPESTNYSLELYNSIGNKVTTFQNINPDLDLEIYLKDYLLNGIYFAIVSNGVDKIIKTRKIIINK